MSILHICTTANDSSNLVFPPLNKMLLCFVTSVVSPLQDTAKSLIEDDTFYTMGLLKKGATHALAPQDSQCCICGSSLSKGSTSGIRVFNCGHSTHLHCESEENESWNNYSSVGCPICLPKKNSHAKNKSVLVENGLVTTSTSSYQPMKGMSNIQHAHEPELDKPYALQQMSRV